MDTKQDQLAIVVKESGLQPNKVETLLQSFAGNFQKAKEIAEEAKAIVVTDEAQTDLMLKARESRLALKAIRVEVEKTRKELKEQSLREGKAIDGIANVIKALVVPVEEHLEKQEKYAEIRELERLQKRYEDRVNRLSPYVEDISLYNIKDMSDDAFEKLLESTVAADKAKKEAEAKAEAERAEIQRKQDVYNDRRLELAPYRDFMNPDFHLTVETTDIDFQSALKAGQEAKKKHDDDQAAIRKQNEELQKKAEADRKAKEEAERKLAEEKAAQEKKEREAREAEAAKKAADEEAKRQALLAPDKEKLLKLANDVELFISAHFPAVESKKAGEVLNYAESKLKAVVEELREGAKTL